MKTESTDGVEGGGVKWRGGRGSQQNKNANEMFLTDSQLLTN